MEVLSLPDSRALRTGTGRAAFLRRSSHYLLCLERAKYVVQTDLPPTVCRVLRGWRGILKNDLGGQRKSDLSSTNGG